MIDVDWHVNKVFQLLKDMNIQYGVWNYIDNKPILDPNSNWEYTKSHGCVLRPEQFRKRKIGTCWDTSLYIYSYFQNRGVNARVVYFNRSNHQSHSFCMIPSSQRWYTVEWSDESNRGVHDIGHASSSLKELIKTALGEYNVSKVEFLNPDVDVSGFVQLNGPVITIDDYLNEAFDVKERLSL